MKLANPTSFPSVQQASSLPTVSVSDEEMRAVAETRRRYCDPHPDHLILGPSQGREPTSAELRERAHRLVARIDALRSEPTMSVRAKFKFESYRTSLHARYPHKDANGKADYGRPETQELRTLEFSPVYSDNPNSENRLFWEATPSGKLELGTVNAEAWSQFELGKEYYLDFTLAE